MCKGFAVNDLRRYKQNLEFKITFSSIQTDQLIFVSKSNCLDITFVLCGMVSVVRAECVHQHNVWLLLSSVCGGFSHCEGHTWRCVGWYPSQDISRGLSLAGGEGF